MPFAIVVNVLRGGVGSGGPHSDGQLAILQENVSIMASLADGAVQAEQTCGSLSGQEVEGHLPVLVWQSRHLVRLHSEGLALPAVVSICEHEGVSLDIAGSDLWGEVESGGIRGAIVAIPVCLVGDDHLSEIGALRQADDIIAKLLLRDIHLRVLHHDRSQLHGLLILEHFDDHLHEVRLWNDEEVLIDIMDTHHLVVLNLSIADLKVHDTLVAHLA